MHKIICNAQELVRNILVQVVEGVMISRQAKVVEKAISSIGLRKITSTMFLNPKRKNRYCQPPKSYYKKYDIKSFISQKRECISLKSTSNPSKHIIYFHGGAYTLQANIVHWKIVNSILSAVPCKLTFINYPLVPEYTCIDCIKIVNAIYKNLIEKNDKEIVLMGDSAGGGLAIALAQNIADENTNPKPKKIVLLSPWLDVSMEDDISKERQDKDLMLDKQTLKIVGQRYAGKLNTKNYLCSPLYGDIDNIGNIALFTGTNDVLNIQAKKLKEKASKCNSTLSYYEYADMQHVWMGLPMPEASDAIDKMVKFIMR